MSNLFICQNPQCGAHVDISDVTVRYETYRGHRCPQCGAWHQFVTAETAERARRDANTIVEVRRCPECGKAFSQAVGHHPSAVLPSALHELIVECRCLIEVPIGEVDSIRPARLDPITGQVVKGEVRRLLQVATHPKQNRWPDLELLETQRFNPPSSGSIMRGG
jgi:DNA-directed RNA polymerase subunit RPC12/RpoP